VIPLDLVDVATGVIFGVFVISVGCLLLISNPRGSPNRWLALYFIPWGITQGFGYLILFLPDPNWSYTISILQVGILAPLLLPYLAFLGSALRSPLARPFRTRAFRAAIFPVAAAFEVAAFRWPYLIIPTGGRNDFGGWTWAYANVFAWLTLPVFLISTFAILAAIHSISLTRAGTIERRRAVAYAIAFTILDVCWILGFLFGYARGSALPVWADTLQNVGYIFGVGALTYGLLKYQLFDFDLKVKWTLKRGTLVAIILGAFFIGSSLAEQYLQQFGWIFGGITVGALLFALRPIERAIDRVADRAMPKTTGTPEYLAQRKHEIYRAAIEDAMRDGVVSAKERALLLRLADNLGLSAEESGRIERDVLGVPPA
jgi:hypothetical protein